MYIFETMLALLTWEKEAKKRDEELKKVLAVRKAAEKIFEMMVTAV